MIRGAAGRTGTEARGRFLAGRNEFDGDAEELCSLVTVWKILMSN